MKLTIRNLRSCNGREGVAYSCTLLVDGKPAAEVVNSGNGGQTMFYWKHPEFEGPVNEYVASMQPEAIPASAPDWERQMYPDGRKWDLDMLVASLCDEADNSRKLRRMCATKTLVRLVGDSDG